MYNDQILRMEVDDQGVLACSATSVVSVILPDPLYQWAPGSGLSGNYSLASHSVQISSLFSVKPPVSRCFGIARLFLHKLIVTGSS